jgi:hypothetical protein
MEYIDRSLQLYRNTRRRVTAAIEQVRAEGFDAVRLNGHKQGPDDILDICRLSCIEQGIRIVEEGNVPVLMIKGAKVILSMPEGESEHG